MEVQKANPGAEPGSRVPDHRAPPRGRTETSGAFADPPSLPGQRPSWPPGSVCALPLAGVHAWSLTRARRALGGFSRLSLSWTPADLELGPLRN